MVGSKVISGGRIGVLDRVVVNIIRVLTVSDSTNIRVDNVVVKKVGKDIRTIREAALNIGI